MLELRDEVRDIVDLRLIAFPQDGILSFPNGKELMREAMRLGCDVIGGIPHYEWTRDDGVEEVHFIFDLAKETGAPIDLHCDETDDEQSRFLEVVAARAIRDGMQGRVVAGHTTAFGSYNDAYAFKLLQILKRAGVTIVANPLDNIVLQGRFDTYPKRRGMTRVKELDAAGINVACGHDSIMDPWYPLGRGSMLDALSMLVHVAQMTGRTELFRAYEMITTNPARAAEVPYGVKEGLPANFVVFDCADEAEAIRLRPAARWVVRMGRVVAETEPARSVVHRAGSTGTGHLHEGRGSQRMTAITHESLGMPKGEGDFTIEGHGMEPIPETARYGSVNRLFTVWFTPNLVPAAFFVGTLASIVGLGWWPGVLAIIVGNVIGAALVGVLRAMGPRTGMAQIPAARLPFGKSIVVPGVINWLSTIAWDAINAFFGAYAIDAIDRRRDPVPGRPADRHRAARPP